MNDARTAPPARTNLVLATLFAGAFAVGCGEMLVVGVLDLLAQGLGVSVPAAGSLVTANAIGLAVGGPVLTALTIRYDRRPVLLGSLIAFGLVMAVPLVFADYHLFLAARLAGGALQGLFIAAAFVIGTSVAPPERAGRAMSIVLSGFAVSTAVGVPIGTVIGHAVGWRGAFVAVLGLASVVLVSAFATMPSTPSVGRGAAGQAASAFAPRVLVMLGLFVLVFAAFSSTLTYLVPFLQRITGVSGDAVSFFLLAYGAATLVGSIGGGRFADAHATGTLIIGTIGLSVALLGMYVAGTSAWLVVVMLTIWGIFGFATTPAMQFRIVSMAGEGGTLAASLPASAANAGVALGSVAGGLTIDPFGVRAVALTGTLIAVASVLGAVLTRGLQPPAADDVDASPTDVAVAP